MHGHTNIKTQIPNFKKIRPAGAELFHAGGRTDMTDMTKLIVSFRNFVNAPKKHRTRGLQLARNELFT